MADLFLNLRSIDYLTDHNTPLRAWRAFAETLFDTVSGFLVPFSCIVDTGAPFSVLPYSLWHDRSIAWTPLGSQLTQLASQTTETLEWQGTPCDLGEAALHLVDLQTQVQAGPFLVVAKFPRQPQARSNLETIALLGMNFLTDNFLRLLLDGWRGSLVGSLSIP
jgi:hypothetical protein